MTGWFITWLIYGIPWQVQTAIMVVIALIVLALLVRIFGFERVKVWIVPVVSFLAALGMLSRSRQQGYNDRRVEEEKALDIAEDFVDDKRDEVQVLPDVELDKKVDKWSRNS